MNYYLLLLNIFLCCSIMEEYNFKWQSEDGDSWVFCQFSGSSGPSITYGNFIWGWWPVLLVIYKKLVPSVLYCFESPDGTFPCSKDLPSEHVGVRSGETLPAELRCCIDVKCFSSKETLVLFQSLSLAENILSQISYCRQAMSTEVGGKKKELKKKNHFCQHICTAQGHF